MNQDTLVRTFFFAAFLFLLYLALGLLLPFFAPIMWAIALSVVFMPLHRKLAAKLGGHKNSAAFLTTAMIILLIVGPFVWFAFALVKEAVQAYPGAQAFIIKLSQLDDASFSAMLPAPLSAVAHWASQMMATLSIDPKTATVRVVRMGTETLLSVGSRAALNTVVFLVDLLALIITVFFLLRDGDVLSKWISDKIPMKKTYKDSVKIRLTTMVESVIRGTLLTATIQGLIAFIGYWIAGLKFPVLLGFVTGFLAIIPLAGAVWGWAPVVIYLWVTQHSVMALFLLIWSLVLVSSLDNVLRPYFIGSRARLPFLLLFFGILGGLKVYGFLGILIGPMIIAAFLAFVQIFEEQYFDHSVNG